jgi:diguanylate cyclase (GGDEF)-like protein/PAS domain S-box-containing protein
MSSSAQHLPSDRSGFGPRRCSDVEDRTATGGAGAHNQPAPDQPSSGGPLAESSREQLISEIDRLRRSLDELRASNADLEEEARALRGSEAKYRVMVENANDAIVVAQDGAIRFVNRKAEAMSGFTEKELTSRPFVEFIHPEDREIVYSRHLIGMRGESGSGMIYPFRILTRSGGAIWVEINPVAIEWQGKPATLNLLADITERKQAEKKIVHLAYHDPLTDLPNRMLFSDRLSVAISQARRNNDLLGVMLIDLDDFKEVNDTLGHSAGDTLLQVLGGRLRSLLRQGDTVARMGGDEFMLLLPGLTSSDDVSVVAEKVLAEVTKPYDIDGGSVNVSASVGTAVFPIEARDDETLLRRVDQAMYLAKEKGGGTHCRFESSGD